MWNRIYALFVARNLEFVRDRSALAWSVLLPVLIIFVFAFAFSEDNPEKFKVGLLSSTEQGGPAVAFRGTKFVKFIGGKLRHKLLKQIIRHSSTQGDSLWSLLDAGQCIWVV